MSKPIQNETIQQVLPEGTPQQDHSATPMETGDSILDLSATAVPVEPTEKEALVILAQHMGWRLIQLNGKSPTKKGWTTSNGLSALEALQYPGNLGIICGEPSGRLFIVDIDGERPEGLPVTPTVLTGSGKLHLYYHLPDGLTLVKENTVSVVAHKVDTRGTGGQIVAPGSIHPDTGGLYHWMSDLSPDDVPIVDVPQWVIDKLQAPREKAPSKKANQAPSTGTRPGSQLPTNARYRTNALEAAAEEVRNAPSGQRNETLNTKAYALAGISALSDEQIEDALLSAAMDAGLSEVEAVTTIKSGIAAGRKAPHSFPQTSVQTAAPADLATLESPEDFKARRCTDVANGVRFERAFQGSVLHSDALGWLVWDGSRFAVDAKSAREYAKSLSDDIRAEIKTLSNMIDPRDHHSAEHFRSYVEALTKWAKVSGSTRGVDNILTEARTTPGINANSLTFDADPWLLNCKNGTIDLRTGDLLAHNPEHRLTMLAPTEYHPEATCPRWDQFLSEIFGGDEELIEYARRALAYSITGETSWQAWFLLHGRGENGKSRFVEVLRHVLGTDFCHEIDPEDLCQQQFSKHTTERAALKGARYLTSEETEENRQLNESFIKALTGEGKLRARFMRQDSFEFQPVCKLWLSTNNKPVVKDSSHGFWRRVRLIPFNSCFANSPNRDPHLSAKLAAEAPGILAQLVRYAKLVHSEGEGKVPECIEAARDEYRTDSDELGRFLAENTVAAQNKNLLKRELYDAYKRETGGRCEAMPTFNARLKARGLKERHTRGGAAWAELLLKPNGVLRDDGDNAEL